LFIGVNEYQNIVYYSKENFEELLDWLLTISILEKMILIILESNPENEEDYKKLHPEIVELINHSFKKYQMVKKLSDESGYRLEEFIDSLNQLAEKIDN